MKKSVIFTSLSMLFIITGNAQNQVPLGPDGLPAGEQAYPVFHHHPENQVPGVQAAGIFFNDSFEDKTYDQWIAQSNDYIVSVDSLNSPDGIFHLAITGGNHLHQRGLMHAFQPSHLDYVGFYVNFSGGPATIGGYFVVLPSGGYIVPSMVFFIFWDDATMRIYDNNSYTTYPFIGGQWYHVEFKNIDWIAQTLDWYVDNTLVIADHPFRASSTLGGVAEVQLYNWDLSTAMYDQVILSGNPTGMPDKNKPFRIDVFPNPAGRDLFIETAGMRHAFFSLQDITGKALLFCEKKEVRTHLDVSHLPQGVYLLKITDSDRGYTETRKVIIQR